MTTIRKNIEDIPYGLHDAVVTELKAEGKKLTMGFEDGYDQNEEPYDRVQGVITFDGVDWDCSFAYEFKCKEFNLENTGAIVGEKYMLKDFAEHFAGQSLEIVDETYGFNQSKFSGYLTRGDKNLECMIEIYHMGDMSYITE